MATLTLAAVQSEPVWFDLDATTDKTIALITEAASAGASLIAFPETWLPGYPSFMWFGDDAYKARFRERYVDNSLVAGSEQHRRIEAAARTCGINVLLGLSERDGDDIFMAQFLISDAGETTMKRRKMKPSGAEWDIFESGPGTDVIVTDSSVGRVGALNCSENRRPLLRHELFSQNEQLHVASWPHFGIYPGFLPMSAEASMLASSQYAAEGLVVTLAPTIVASPGYLEILDLPEEERDRFQIGNGSTRIFGPHGESISDPLPHDVDGIVYATVDASLILRDQAYDAEPANVRKPW